VKVHDLGLLLEPTRLVNGTFSFNVLVDAMSCYYKQQLPDVSQIKSK